MCSPTRSAMLISCFRAVTPIGIGIVGSARAGFCCCANVYVHTSQVVKCHCSARSPEHSKRILRALEVCLFFCVGISARARSASFGVFTPKSSVASASPNTTPPPHKQIVTASIALCDFAAQWWPRCVRWLLARLRFMDSEHCGSASQRYTIHGDRVYVYQHAKFKFKLNQFATTTAQHTAHTARCMCCLYAHLSLRMCVIITAHSVKIGG